MNIDDARCVRKNAQKIPIHSLRTPIKRHMYVHFFFFLNSSHMFTSLNHVGISVPEIIEGSPSGSLPLCP